MVPRPTTHDPRPTHPRLRPTTRAYVARQLAHGRQFAHGRSKKDVLRLLKRAIAREMFRLLTQQCDIDDCRDLRPARQAKNITLTTAGSHFGVRPTVISRLGRGLKRDNHLAINNRNG